MSPPVGPATGWAALVLCFCSQAGILVFNHRLGTGHTTPAPASASTPAPVPAESGPCGFSQFELGLTAALAFIAGSVCCYVCLSVAAAVTGGAFGFTAGAGAGALAGRALSLPRASEEAPRGSFVAPVRVSEEAPRRPASVAISAEARRPCRAAPRRPLALEDYQADRGSVPLVTAEVSELVPGEF